MASMTYQELLTEWNSGSSYLEVRTSGSTGDPKTIRLDKTTVIQSAERTNSFFSINKESRLHSCVSPEFIGGKMMLVRAVISGARLTWEKPTNRPLRTLTDNTPVDLLAVVPSQMVDILDNIRNLPEIRNIIIGGSAIHKDLRKRIAESPLCCFETYGMTETASHIALRKITDDDMPFTTLPPVSVRADSEGCLAIDLHNGHEEIITHDLAVVENGTTFRITGRIDNVIISGGRKLVAEDIEARLASVIGCNFAIGAEDDVKWGKKVVLYIENDSRLSDKDKKTVEDCCRKVLHTFEIPKDIVAVRSIPLTPNGKINRKKLSSSKI